MLYWITHRVLVVMVGEQDAACLATQQKKEREVSESYISVILASLMDGASLQYAQNDGVVIRNENNKTHQQLSVSTRKTPRWTGRDVQIG